MKEYFAVFKVMASSSHDALCQAEGYLQNGCGEVPADVTVGSEPERIPFNSGLTTVTLPRLKFPLLSQPFLKNHKGEQ